MSSRIFENGLIAGGKQNKEGRQTIFFTLLNSVGVNFDEEACECNSQESALSQEL